MLIYKHDKEILTLKVEKIKNKNSRNIPINVLKR